MSFSTALQFMLSLNFERFSNSTVSEVDFPGNHSQDASLSADVYRQPGREKQSRGVIVVVHGMTVTGNRDPRIINLCRALAEVGYTAVAPLIPGIQDQQIRPNSYDDVADFIQRITDNAEICPQGRIGMLGPSFSGGACLIGAAKPENIDRVSAICTIGAYASIRSVFDFFFRSNDPDEYGKTIVMWNFVEYAVGKNPAVRDAFKLATLDNGYLRSDEEAELPGFLEKMKPADRELFEKIRYDGAHRLELWEQKISKHPALQEWQTTMECAANLRAGMAPVILVHGRADDVIPPSESEMLYARLKELGVPTRLCITDLISHGDHGLTLGMIPQAFGLAGAFGEFFHHVG